MTAKEYLKQAKWIEVRIYIKQQQLQNIRELSTSVNAMLSGMPSGTRDVHSQEKLLAKIVDLEAEIKTEFKRLVDVKNDINEKLNRMQNNDYKLLLGLRYICNEQWDDICQKLCYSKRSVYRHHGLALKEFEKILHE